MGTRDRRAAFVFPSADRDFVKARRRHGLGEFGGGRRLRNRLRAPYDILALVTMLAVRSNHAGSHLSCHDHLLVSLRVLLAHSR